MRVFAVLVFVGVPTAALAQPVSEEALIKSIFEKLNPISIAENREYCGYVGFDRVGVLIASDAVPGDVDSSLPPIRSRS